MTLLVCEAIDCQHNKSKRCKLKSIKININFECSSFKSIYE